MRKARARQRSATVIPGPGRAGLLIATMTAAAVAAVAWPSLGRSAEIVTLTQVGCQFVESENGINHNYTTTKKEDCLAINGKTGADRLANAKPMVLKPGKYIFRVTNQNVPYALGFYLREKDYDWRNPVHQATKTAVSGGGLDKGVTRDYEVTLKPGEYEYSCPLNPTPDYKLVVKN